MADFKVSFSTDQHKMQVQFDGGNGFIPAFGEVQTVNTVGKLYKGDYAVTPKVDEQVMPTKGKYMIDDVTVNPIPIFEVSNSSGGTTVYIAKEM